MRPPGLPNVGAMLAVAGLIASRVALGQVPDAQRAAPPGSAVAEARHDSRICAVGDVTLGTNLDTAWLRQALRPPSGTTAESARALLSPDTLIAPLRPLVRGADIVLINLEGAIGDDPVDEPKCATDHKSCFALRAPSTAARALRSVADSPAIVVVNLANNHARDAGPASVDVTRRWLDSARVITVGIDSEPALAVTAGGDTIAVLGFSAWAPPSVQDTAAVRRLVTAAVARYGRVIVTAHMGAEGRAAQRTMDSVERFVGEDRGNPVAFAHVAADAGAALIVGHGPHVLRAAEWRHRALILYSLGNLINYGPFGLGEPMDRGAVVCVTLGSGGRARDAVLDATWQREAGVMSPDRRARARTLVDSLGRLDFPATGATVDRATGAMGDGRSASRRVSRLRAPRLARPPKLPPTSRPPAARAPDAPPATASPPAPSGG